MSSPLRFAESLVLRDQLQNLRHAVRRLGGGMQNPLQTLQKLADRLNTWPEKKEVNHRLEALLLTSAPLFTFGLVYLAASTAGVAYHPGCNSTSNFISNLVFRPERPSTCRSVAFLNDIPMVILSLTCPLAIVTFHLIRWRLARLNRTLVKSRLIRGRELERSEPQIERLENIVDLKPSIRIPLFAATVAMTTWLYTRALNHGHLFVILARNGVSTEADLRDRWWANYHHHLWLAGLCVLVGSFGVYYALRLAGVYFGVGIGFFKLAKNTEFEYVPRWQDKSYGWGPISAALFLVYVSLVTLTVSMVSVGEMLQGKTWTLMVAIFFGVLGLAANASILGGSFYLMLRGHSKVERRLRDWLNGLPPEQNPGLIPVTSSDTDSQKLFKNVVAASDLASWRKIPVASLSGAAIKLVPGAYALIQFAVRFSFIRR